MLREGLAVMDATAVVLCVNMGCPLRVMNINTEGALQRVVQGRRSAPWSRVERSHD